MAVQPKRIVTPQISISSPSGFSVRILVALGFLVVWTLGVYLISSSGSDGDGSVDGGPQTEYELIRMQEEGRGETLTPNLQLHIKDIAIIPSDRKGAFKYKATIEPLLGMDGVASGMLQLVVSGENDGNAQIIEIPDSKNDVENGYRPFSLSQDLSGELSLPDGFEPEKLDLKLFTGEDTTTPLIQKYSWSDVLSEQKKENKANKSDKLLDELERENLALKIKLAKAEAAQSAGAVPSGSSDGLVQTLKQERDAMAREIEELKKQVSDFRERVNIKDIRLRTTGSGDVELYISVVRSVQDGSRLTGILQVSMIGTEGGQQKVYMQEQITPDNTARFKLGFRNFQEIREKLSVPSGFTPQKLTIQIALENEGIKDMNKVYDWDKLIAE